MMTNNNLVQKIQIFIKHKQIIRTIFFELVKEDKLIKIKILRHQLILKVFITKNF